MALESNLWTARVLYSCGVSAGGVPAAFRFEPGSKEESLSRKRVVVTGLGCISPLGHTVKSTWEAILAGVSGVGPITHFDASDFLTRFAAEVKDFDPVAEIGAKLARRVDRFTHFALVATKQALESAKLKITETNRDRIGAIIGSGIGGIGSLVGEMKRFLDMGPRRVSPFLVPMMLPDTAAGQVAIEPGYDGTYGKINIFGGEKAAAQATSPSPQMDLF